MPCLCLSCEGLCKVNFLDGFRIVLGNIISLLLPTLMTNKLWTSLVFYYFISFILLFIHFSDEEVSRKATITTTISIDCVTKVTWMEFNKTKVNSTATWKSTKKPSKNVTPSDGSKAKIAFSPFLKKGKSQWRLIHQNLVRTIWVTRKEYGVLCLVLIQWCARFLLLFVRFCFL